jgi:PAS domain S-box-containing protein
VEDISQRESAEALLSAEKHTLQMIAEGAALPDVLNDLCGAIDEQSPGLMSMVSLIEPDGQHLRPIAGPHVPEGWKRTITPTTIGPCAGSCGTAAFRVQPVVVPDIARDPLWAKSRDVAMSYGLRACWSAPLVSTTGDVLGTFAMCFLESRNPGEADLTLMERAVQMARIAIERELVRKALRHSEQRFRLMVEGVKDYAIFMLDLEGRVTTWNDGAERIKGYREEEILGQPFSRFYPPEEVAQGKPEEILALAAATGRAQQEGYRLRKDGTRFWADIVITAIRDEEGELIGFSKVACDLTARRHAEEELRRKEAYLAEGQRLSRTGSWAWNVSNGELFWSLEHFRIFGLDPEKAKPSYEMVFEMVHLEDRPFIKQTFETAVRERRDFDSDYQIVRPDGMIRHIHSLAHPVFNESGELTEYVGTVIDTTEQHQARAALTQAFEEIDTLKERLHHENVALREEIDRTSMFEEIVGSSPAVRAVLSRVAKVAPMDSTVLITGETGTGKELIARAIHKCSKRANRAFVAFNCAGIPPTLIASELFGHEKGAFTGAQQRRLGRFELAGGGTIFLDEIGELPAETQIALLRVLQEREFERVGGSQPISIDVRVITASNRNLQDAIAAGTFRLDLFHRLNVFPIEVPTLRERKEDIPMLLDYFIKRYAEKAGKTIRSIDKKTVEMFKSYSWLGNIRELQNVIERSMIVGESEVFSVDPSWLSTAPVQSKGSSSTLAEKLHDQEQKIIEASLAESNGRIAGRCGAAAKLGIPSSTLESKIKLLKIKKNHFKPD